MKKLLLPGLALLALSSCYNDKAELLYPANACNLDTVTYSKTIQPIMAQNCAMGGCHNTAAANAGVILDNYNGVRTAALGPRFTGSITHASGFSPMPKNMAKMDDCTIQKISKWVTAGAPNN